MTETTLEFTVTIKGDETALHNLQNQLNDPSSNPSTLGEVLPVMIKKTLLAIGDSPEVEVELHPSHLINHAEGIGGLTGDLWLETNNPDYHRDDELIFLRAFSDDEILCSD
jgi:hypothetical protein